MLPKTQKLIDDIRDAAEFIGQTLSNKTLDDYESDRLLRQAIERNFEIIGEAMRRLADYDVATAIALGDYPRIISFRNILIHGYDLIDMPQVWRVATENIPELLERLADVTGP